MTTPDRPTDRTPASHVDSDAAHVELRDLLNGRVECLQSEITAKLSDASQLLRLLDSGSDRDDLLFSDEVAEVDRAEALRDIIELRDTRRALQRLAAGDYGRCEICNEPIPPARLAAQPTATACVRCQTRREGRR